jgi:hypothetical protein
MISRRRKLANWVIRLANIIHQEVTDKLCKDIGAIFLEIIEKLLKDIHFIQLLHFPSK